MTDLEKLTQLYNSRNDPTKPSAQRARADEILKSVEDKVVAEYMARPEHVYAETLKFGGLHVEAGEPRYKTFEDLALSVTFWMRREQGESDTNFIARMERVRQDKIGVIFCHREHRNATVKSTDASDTITLYGNTYALHLGPARENL